MSNNDDEERILELLRREASRGRQHTGDSSWHDRSAAGKALVERAWLDSLIVELEADGVGLWSSSDGALWLEVPKRTADYFGHVTKVGDQLQISRSEQELKGLWGYFSMLSGALVLETSVGNFEGRCRKFDA